MPRWLSWALLAVISWGIWAIMWKLIPLSPAHGQALSTIGLLPVMAALGFSRNLAARSARPSGIAYAFIAGVLVCIGNAAYYDLLDRGEKAAIVVSLTSLYPLVTVLLAVAILRERLNAIQVGGLLLALVAIYLFNVEKDQGLESTSLGLILAPILLWGIAGLLQKVSTDKVSGDMAALVFLSAFLPVAAVILLREPLQENPGLKTWLLVAAFGLSFALGNYALLAAFASGGRASVIAPIAGLYPVVSVPIAIIFFREETTRRQSIAILLALAAVVALSLERRLSAAPLPTTLEPPVKQ